MPDNGKIVPVDSDKAAAEKPASGEPEGLKPESGKSGGRESAAAIAGAAIPGGFEQCSGAARLLPNPDSCSESGKRRLFLLLFSLFLLPLFFFFRGLRLNSAFLPQIDELCLLNQADIPLLSGGSFSTTYFPYSMLTKLLLPGAGFDIFRPIAVFSQLVGIIFLLLAGRRSMRPEVLAGAALLVICHWYFNYIGRLFEVGSFSILFFGLHLYFLQSWFWKQPQDSWSTRAAAFVSLVAAGLGLSNCAAPWLYYLPFLGVGLAFYCWKTRPPAAPLLAGCAAFAAGAAPFLYVLQHTDARRDWSYITHFSGPGGQAFSPSLRSPEIFYKTVTETFTYHSGTAVGGLQGLAAMLIVTAPFLTQLIAGSSSRFERLVSAGFVFQLLEIFLSPAVPNHSGHLAFVLIFYFTALSLGAERGRPGRMVSLAALFAIVIYGCGDFAARFASQDQRSLALSALDQASAFGQSPPQALSATGFSDGALLKFLWLGAIGSPAGLNVVLCDGPSRFGKDALSSYRYLFLTSECEDFLPPGEFAKEWKTNQLVEASSSHGMAFYRRARESGYSDKPSPKGQ